jgi:hypothetical protein
LLSLLVTYTSARSIPVVANALPDTRLVLVHLGGVDVAVADLQRGLDGFGRLIRVDLEYTEAQLRDCRAVVEFDRRYVAHS